jgi:hypothetical protein
MVFSVTINPEVSLAWTRKVVSVPGAFGGKFLGWGSVGRERVVPYDGARSYRSEPSCMDTDPSDHLSSRALLWRFCHQHMYHFA